MFCKCACPERKCLYIRRQFEAKNLNDRKEIDVHPICATDTENISNFICNAVTVTIVVNALRRFGLY